MPSAVTLTVSNLPASTSFFLSALQPLEYSYRGATDNNTTIAFGPSSNSESPPDFWLTQEIAGVPAGAAHVAFSAKTRIAVQQFFNAALKAGAKVHGEPAVRDASGYYSGAVIDFDGNSIEAVYRPSHSDENKENVPNETNTIVPAATKTEVSRAVTSPQTTRAESVKAPPQSSSSPKFQTAQSGDVIDVAANLARNVVQTLRPGSTHSNSSHSNKNAENAENSRGSNVKAVGALLGAAAGAALTYALGNKKEKDRDRERNTHRPFSPPRSSTYSGPAASRYHSSSDLTSDAYRYTQSPRATDAPPFSRRRSSSCTTSPRHRGMDFDEFDYAHHRRKSSAARGTSRRGRRHSEAPIATPVSSPEAAWSTASKRSRRKSASNSTATARPPPAPSSKHDRDRDRTSFPPSSFSPSTKNKVAAADAAAEASHIPHFPPSRAHTYDANGAGPRSSGSSVTTVNPVTRRPSSSSHRTRRHHDSRAVTTDPEDPDLASPWDHERSRPRRHTAASSRPRADTWHAGGPPPVGRGPPPVAVPIPPPQVVLSRRKSNVKEAGGNGPYHRSRKGSMRKNRVVGVDDPDFDDRDFGGGGSVEAGSGLRGGIMDQEIMPDDSISQVSTNV